VDGRNGGGDDHGRGGYRPGRRRVGLGWGRHRVGQHRADRRRDRQFWIDIGRDIRYRTGQGRPIELMAESAETGWSGVDPAELDRLAGVSDEVLSEQVAEHGRCMWEISSGDPPGWSGQGTADRELAARLCAGCPVRAECLEFELRTAGADTVGVWGGLAEDDRRALYVTWLARTKSGDLMPGPDRQQESISDDRAEQDGGDR
jgi:WhiB family transcriptional regulator, redox-sensing transcriptional regulator